MDAKKGEVGAAGPSGTFPSASGKKKAKAPAAPNQSKVLPKSPKSQKRFVAKTDADRGAVVDRGATEHNFLTDVSCIGFPV